jgi:hypothetical protein
MKRRALPVFVCSACTYPSRVLGECDNPACLKNPHANHEALREQAERYLARKAEEKERMAFRKRLRKSGFTTIF